MKQSVCVVNHTTCKAFKTESNVSYFHAMKQQLRYVKRDMALKHRRKVG